jgi:hypothetical protein
MATFTPLTKEGENFIKTICKGTGNSLLQGKNKNGVLPYCDPPTSSNKIWMANAKDSAGILITTNQQLGESLINWFNKYGKLYLMDANVIAAQAYVESGYNIWTYPTTSTASGISQFVVEAMYDIIITNKHSQYCPPNTNMTTSEINSIVAGIKGIENKTPLEITAIINSSTTYDVSGLLGKQNRPTIHQNMIDNPEIMIKAQFRYMKYIANAYSTLASNVLFGYSRGPGFVEKIYSDSINHARKDRKDDYVKEGVEYVFRIFSILGDKNNKTGNNKPNGIYFGYDNLNMNAPPSQQVVNFDTNNANIAESIIKYPTK